MKKFFLSTLLVIAAVTLLSESFTQAAIITTGNVEPADPSTWDSSTSAYIGNSADGSLTVNGDSDVVSYRSYLGYSPGVTGTATVDGAGSTWTSSNYIYSGYNGTGVFDITNGGSVSATRGYIGYNSGSMGAVTVDGAGSTWTNSQNLYVGNTGKGTLNITNGGAVSNTRGYIGANHGSNGTVIVDGTGSTWTNSNILYVGNSGTGTLSISDGGEVTATGIPVNNLSTLTTDLGYGSSLTIGSGSGPLTNNGTIRLVAGSGAASGTYTPMSYSTMDGTGTVQTLGGVWDAANHTVTVSDAELTLAGKAKSIDLAMTQRLLIIDAPTAQVAGASFMASESSIDLTFTASLMDESELSLLESSLAPGEFILTGWDFSVSGSGYTDGDPVYLSLEIGSGYDLAALAIWGYDGTWTEYAASDLAYDDVYASFTVTDFSGYAVTGTAPVPIPAAVWLLGSGLFCLVGIRRKK